MRKKVKDGHEFVMKVKSYALDKEMNFKQLQLRLKMYLLGAYCSLTEIHFQLE
jgi:hypothetical protein